MRFHDIALSYMRTTFILDSFLVVCDLASLGITVTSSGNKLGYLSPGRFLKLSRVISLCATGISYSVMSTTDIVARSVRQFQKDRDEQATHKVLVMGYYHKVAFHMGFQDIALSYMRTTFILDGFLVGCDLASLSLTATSSGLIVEQNY